MKRNLGNGDRIIRVLLAVVFGILFFTGTITGTPGVILLILGGIFLVTGLISWCPIYAMVGLSSRAGKAQA